MNKIITIILFSSVIILSSACVADSSSAKADTSPECLSMHVVHNASAGSINALGSIKGFHIELLNALQERTSFCMNKKLLPYSRAKRSIEMAAHDGGILASSKGLDNKVIYIAKILTSKTIIIPKKEISLKNYQDLTKITIGRVRGAKLSNAIDSDNNLTFVDVLNYKNGLDMLKKGRIDAIAGNSLGLTMISTPDAQSYLNLSAKYVIGEREVWLLLSNKSKHLAKVETLRKATLDLINEKFVDKILEKYFGHHWEMSN